MRTEKGRYESKIRQQPTRGSREGATISGRVDDTNEARESPLIAPLGVYSFAYGDDSRAPQY